MEALGNYRMLRRLGAGAMGEVWLAEHALLRVTRAVKLLPPGLESSPGARARFLEEGRLLAGLNHPSIVQVHDMGVEGDRFFLVMDFVSPDGQSSLSLGDLLSRGPGRVPPDTAADILRQVCGGVAHAHGRGVIHRDIKPANILMGPGGRIRVSDFGLARMLGEAGFARGGDEGSLGAEATIAPPPLMGAPSPDSVGIFATMDTATPDTARRLVGTMHYMPPEVHERGADAWSTQGDVYSLGVLAYVLLVGKPPMGAWKPPSRAVAEASPRWDEIVETCLEDPPARYASVEALLRALEGLGCPDDKPAPSPPGGDASPDRRQTADVSPDAALLAETEMLLRRGAFQRAADKAAQAISLAPGEALAHFYLALAKIAGRRLLSLTLKEAREIDQLADTARDLDPEEPVYGALMILLRQDYFALNGIKAPSPSIGDLLETFGRRDARPASRDLLAHCVRVADKSVFELL